MKRVAGSRRHGGGKNSNLTQGDLQLIKTIKRERATLSLREIYVGSEFCGNSKRKLQGRQFYAPLTIMLSGLKYSG